MNHWQVEVPMKRSTLIVLTLILLISALTDVEISLLGLDYGDYTLTVVMYVEGSSYPMPTNGKDYQGLQNVTISSNAITVETPIELAPVQMGF
jgi:hypothetical protein